MQKQERFLQVRMPKPSALLTLVLSLMFLAPHSSHAGKTIDWTRPVRVQPMPAGVRSGLAKERVVPEPSQPQANFPTNCLDHLAYYLGYNGQYIWTTTHGTVESWVALLDVRLPLVTFRHTFVFRDDGALITSESTLRFRTQSEIADTLSQAHLTLQAVRDAPDRPGLELVLLARRKASRQAS